MPDQKNARGAQPNNIPKDTVLLIPEPEDENTRPPYEVAPGYYNPKQLLDLLVQHKHNPDAIHFIADMLENGNPQDDTFVELLRANHTDPVAITRIVKAALMPE